MDLFDRGRSMEDAFFKERDAKLIEKLHKENEVRHSREELARVSGIRNSEVLDKLIALKVTPKLLTSLSLLPLVEVAWADGKVDAKEREAVLKASSENGFIKGTIDYQLLESWLREKPPARFLEAWLYYMEGLREVLTQQELDDLKTTIMGRARRVAESAGGFMGLGMKISDQERDVLEKMENAFKR